MVKDIGDMISGREGEKSGLSQKDNQYFQKYSTKNLSRSSQQIELSSKNEIEDIISTSFRAEILTELDEFEG